MRIDPNKLYLRCAELEMKERQAMQKAGVAVNLISKIRNGHRVQAQTLAKIAKVLQCRPQDLVVME